jgi:ribonuclease J
MDEYRDDELCVVVAGSQGQPGSSLVRAVFGEHHQLSIGPKDKVVFATEPIPGNEQNVYEAIDELSRNRIDISYSDIASGLHVSGHASSTEQMLLIAMLKPKYLFPIGGSDRHRVQFAKAVMPMGYKKSDVLLPVEGEVVAFDHDEVKKAETLVLKSLMVDGLGVGDVGTVVLSDRKQMAEEGMIVVIIPETAGEYDAGNLKIVSRGFVFMRQADEVIQAIKEETALVLKEGGDEQEIKRKIEKRVVKRMEEVIGRKPLVLPVFMSL